MSDLKFTQEVKDKWLEALRSGEYKQGFTELHTRLENTYCCIGVLGKITDGLECDNHDDETSPYVFLENTIGKENTRDLWRTNDLNHKINFKCDYSNVIPVIESLEVQD